MCLLVEGSEETVAVEEEEELGWKGKVKLEMAYGSRSIARPYRSSKGELAAGS